jgi:KaiC/GvpD/RAD55 family RecA-like ATPase
MRLDFEKTILIIMINHIESFENTCLKKGFFQNENYAKMFEYLDEYYKKHQSIDYIDILKEHEDFNSTLYLELEKTKLPIDDWQKSLISLEDEIIKEYKLLWVKKLASANLTFDEFKEKIDILAKIDATKLKYYKTISEINIQKTEDITYIKSGIEDIDQCTKGFALGELSVWSGGNGSGKSTLLNQLAIESIKQNYNTLIFSGELKDSRLMKWISLQVCGKNNLFYNKEYDFYYPKDKEAVVKTLDNKLFVYDNELGNDISKIIFAIYDAVKTKNVKMVILDNLMSMNLSSYGQDKYDVQTKLITDLSDMAKRLGIHIHFVCHPRKSTNFLRKYDISGTADLTNIADNVFIVHRVNDDFKKQFQEMFKKTDKELMSYDNIIEICKNREYGVQDMFVGQFFETETKRFLNFENEPKYYM